MQIVCEIRKIHIKFVEFKVLYSAEHFGIIESRRAVAKRSQNPLQLHVFLLLYIFCRELNERKELKLCQKQSFRK